MWPPLSRCPNLFQLETEFFEDWAVTSFVIGIAGGVMAKHTLAPVLTYRLLPLTKMVVEGLGHEEGVVGVLAITMSRTRGTRPCILYNLAILPDWSKERNLRINQHSLKGCLRQRMTA